jgi:hypothetical protein
LTAAGSTGPEDHQDDPGYRHRPIYRRRTKRSAEWEVAVERPTYDLTIFKLHCGKLTLKIYTKGERVLRIEAVAHNTRSSTAVARWKSFLRWSPD